MTDLPVRAPVPGPARVVAFLVLLVALTAAGWGVGRMANPPVPVPDLPTPAVLDGPGQHGHPR